METKQKGQFSTVDQYIALQPPPMRATLEKLRVTIKKAAPKAEEVISYQMPAYKFHGILLWFAAYKNHFGLYIPPKSLQVFKNKLSAYKLAKATIQFPWDQPLPVKLITEMIKYRVKENLEKKTIKEMSSKTKK